ncbi:MAG TPA: CDP-alcohol phosphatidyltransferase family protein [Chloroflexota bacterium]|nr:CDP-alcohol phosphatidyltransferase family protein [Chloroflexota bacterium]
MAAQPSAASSAPRGVQTRARAAVVPLARKLARAGVTANSLTIAGAILNAGVAAAIAAGWFPASGLLLLAANSLDMLDGAVARASGRASPFGAFLDSTLDRYAEIIVFVGLVGWFASQGNWHGVVLSVLALAGSLMVSYTRARAEGLGLHGEVGLLPRPARLIALAAGLMLAAVPALAWTLEAVVALLAVFTNLTAVQRGQHVYQQTHPR